MLMATRSPTKRSSERTAWLVALALLLAIAAWWRFETLDRRPLWLDEQSTARVVAGSPDLVALWNTGSADKYLHPPLAYLGQWLATRGAPEPTPFRLRLPAAVAGLLSLALLAALGALVFDGATGLVAAGLMAVSIYHVDYSQEARPYMAALALTLGHYAALFAWLERGHVRWLACFAACAVLALYTHHLALIHVAVSAGVAAALALGVGRSRRSWKPLAVALGCVALAYVPQLSNLVGFLSSEETTARHTLALGPRFLHAAVQRWGSGAGATTLLYEACFLAGALHVALRRDATALALFGWVAGPLAAFTVMPFAKYFDLRFAISSLPAFFLFVAAGATVAARAGAALAVRAGLDARATPILRASILCAAALAFAAPAWRLYERFRVADWRCGDFVDRVEILEANGRLCADHLVLNSIWVEHQWIVRSVRPVIDLAAHELDAFVGSYRFEAGPKIGIARSESHLVAQVEGNRAHRLDPTAPTRFFYRTLGARTIDFERDARGEVTSLVVTSRDGRAARAWRER
jgi:hypothetical protein